MNFAINVDLKTKNDKYKKLKGHLENTVNVRTKELKIANDNLFLAKQKAEESESLKTNFLATISHEIRTPLTSIVGFSQLISKAKANPDKLKKYVETVEDSTGQLLNIIDNILELSKIHSNSHTSSKSEINSKELTQFFEKEALKTLNKYNKNLYIHSQYEDNSLFSINIGSNELIRIISHLLDNAVKYTQEGEIAFSCKINKNGLFEICISDSGIGITPEQQSTIFDFFRQIDQEDTRKYSGIGVGLSICKGLVHKSSGSIWIESNHNKGTKVFVTIPLSQ